MNFGELKTSIANHLHRTDLTSVIPDFVIFAESTIQNDPSPSEMMVLPGIRTKDQVTRLTSVINAEYEDAPTDLLSIKDAQINNDPVQPLTYLTPNEMSFKYPTSLTGTPEAYTLHGDEFQFKPIPSGDLTLEISYVKRYAALSADTDTNWLLTNHPMAYLYAALVAASSYVQEDPTMWATMYKSIAYGINGMADKGQHPSRLSAKVSTATP